MLMNNPAFRILVSEPVKLGRRCYVGEPLDKKAGLPPSWRRWRGKLVAVLSCSW